MWCNCMFLFNNKVDCKLDSETWGHKEVTKEIFVFIYIRKYFLEVYGDFCEIKARKES